MRDKSWSSIGGNKIHAVKYSTNRIENKIKQQETNKNQQFWNQNPYIEKAETAYKKNHLRNRGGSDVFKRFGFRGCGCGSMNVSDGYIKRCYNVWRYINLRKIQNSKPIKMNILMQFNNKKGKKLIRIPCSMKQKESICL